MIQLLLSLMTIIMLHSVSSSHMQIVSRGTVVSHTVGPETPHASPVMAAPAVRPVRSQLAPAVPAMTTLPTGPPRIYSSPAPSVVPAPPIIQDPEPHDPIAPHRPIGGGCGQCGGRVSPTYACPNLCFY